MSIDFSDQVAIVTGAGTGLGRSHAIELAARGAAVVVNDLHNPEADGPSSAQGVVDEINSLGGVAVANHDSVSTPEGGAAIVETAVSEFGRIDVVVNNAGIVRDGSFAKLPIESIHSVLDVHLRAAFYVTQPAFVKMKEQSYGRIVFTTSGAGLFGNFGQANYAAAKTGLVGLANVLAIEGARYGIHANSIAPAARTQMNEGLLGDLTDALDPELVTSMVVFLASRDCAATGEVYSAMGGRYARVFTGLTKGWFAGFDNRPTADDVFAHIDDINAEAGYRVPTDVTTEVDELNAYLKDATS